MDYTALVIAALFGANGIVTVLIMAILNRRKAHIEADALAEDAQGKEIGNLQIIIDEWQKHYGTLNERTRTTESDLQNFRTENEALRKKQRELEDGAQLAYEKLRLEISEERKQRHAQTNLIIDLTTEVTRLSGIVDAQSATISTLRADLTKSEKKRTELQANLTRAESEIKVLRAQVEILRSND